MTLKAIRLAMSLEAPASTEPSRKTIRQASHKRLAPNRASAHPVNGIIMASASK
jgi:hypothetical protein